MNINSIDTGVNYKKINKLCESRFGFTLNFDRLTLNKAKKIYETVNAGIEKIRRSEGIHESHVNKKYMELLTIREGLKDWISKKNIFESETAQAEVLLAAKNIVDEIQAMTEKVSKIQNEDLVAIVDASRDTIGVQQADQFRDTVFQSLSELLTILQAQRETIDTSVRQLAGEPVSDTGVMQGAEPQLPPDLDSGEEISPKPTARPRRTTDIDRI